MEVLPPQTAETDANDSLNCKMSDAPSLTSQSSLSCDGISPESGHQEESPRLRSVPTGFRRFLSDPCIRVEDNNDGKETKENRQDAHVNENDDQQEFGDPTNDANKSGPQQVEQTQPPSQPELDWTMLKWGKLYGREKEIRELQQAFHRRLTADTTTTELALVSGNSGTGKTVLVKKALQQLVEEHHGHFIVGKFDQLQTPDPYGPLVAALTQLVIVLEQASCHEIMDGLRKRIHKHVGMEACHVLCALVPALSRILRIHQDKSSKSALSVQQERLKVALKKLLQVICSSNQPLVLALDDLQWADAGSLNLLESLVTDEIEGLMLVGICRSNEVPWHHTFANMLRRLEDDAGARIVHVEVKQLPIEATYALLSDMLRQPVDVCRPLAEIIHAKSCGNVFFILQILKTLHSEGVLVAERDDSGAYHWLWHDDQWDNSFQSLDIVDLVSFQIKGLPDSCQRLLKTAACIGADFDERAITNLLEDISAKEVLKVALEEQMVVQQIHRPGKYAFAHDRIQQAAYALIPTNELVITHLTIGRTLLQNFEPNELEDNLFLVVNQLIRGIPLLTTEIDKNGLAELCLRAGQQTKRASDFETARQYFNTGTTLLSNRHWRDEYHLSLQLFNNRAEVESGCGVFDKMDATIQEVQSNCRTPTDKLATNLVKIYSLAARTRFQEAIYIGFEVMETLNQHFPSKPRLVYLIPELVKVKRRLYGKSDQDILNLPRMDTTDKNTATAMKVLEALSICEFCGSPDYFPFTILRMVKLTLKHGHSEMSPITFASYGMILCVLDEFEEACRYAQLSLQLLDRDTETRMDWLPRVYFIVHSVIYPWKMPVRKTFDSMRVAIAAGIESCDFECSVYSAYTYIMQHYLAGEPLSKVESLFHQYLPYMKHFKQGPWLSLTYLFQRVVSSLMGTTDDPLALDIDSDEFNTTTESNKFSFQLLENTLMLHRLVIAYHLGHVDKAVVAAKAVRSSEKATKGVFVILFHYFYDGMAMYEAAHHGSKRQYVSQGRKLLKKLEVLSKQSPENVLHKVYLLKGEAQALKGNLRKALEWYDKASAHASTEGALQFQALAHERAGVACERLGKESGSAEASKQLFQQAVQVYEQWGGTAFATHIKETHNL